MKEFVASVCTVLEADEALTLATVVESSGSTPRSSGAKMAIRNDGTIFGTVGGGLMEAEAIRAGLAMLDQKDGDARLIHVDMTRELAADSDMICGGGLTVFLQVVRPGGECAARYRELNQRMKTGKPSLLRTSLVDGDPLVATRHEILSGTDALAPEVSVSPGFSRSEGVFVLDEPFIPPAPLFIIGAGHVSLFTARVGQMVGFRTVVVDDRAEYANEDRFPQADEIVVLDEFKGCCDRLGIGDDAFIVIVTRGHLHDRTVLEESLKTNARYIGMIGSKSKRDKIYEALLSNGCSQQDIDRCHCPIGIGIGGQTPEEIAVSICAELIKVRSESGA